MIIKKIAAAICAVTMCVCFTACSSSDSSSSSSKADSTANTTSAATTTTPSSSVAEATTTTADYGKTTTYDVKGDTRCFDTLKEKYGKDGYKLSFSTMLSGESTDYVVCVKGDKAYMASTVQGMKSYQVCPGDGRTYRVNEATTTYNILLEDSSINYATQADFLFGATKDFDHAEVDSDTNIILEYYNMDSTVTGNSGKVVYGFRGDTMELVELAIVYDEADDPVYYTVSGLEKADESLLAVPDLDSYTRV